MGGAGEATQPRPAAQGLRGPIADLADGEPLARYLGDTA